MATVVDKHWKIEILDGPRGSVLATVRPSSFRFNKTMNQKQGFTASIPWDGNFSIGRYIYLKHDNHTTNIWFYGRIDDVSKDYESDQGQGVTISGYCNIQELSEINAEQLELFDWGWRTPTVVKRINTTPSDPIDHIDQNEPLLYDGANSPIFEWRQTAADGHSKIDTLMVGCRVPFRAIHIDIDPGFTETWAGGDGALHVELLGGDGSWDFVELPFDSTSNLNQSGTITFADPSGGWIKHNQSDDYLFFVRIWFQNLTTTKDRNIGIREITIDQRIATPNAIPKLAALMPGWTLSSSTTVDDLYHHAAGESVTEVLGLLSRMTGGFWYNASTALSSIVGWGATSDVNLVAKESATYTFSNANNNIVGLTGREVAPSATRLTLYGSGHGQNRLTAALQNGDVTLPAGYSYNPSTNILINNTAETTLGRTIHKEVNFPWVSALFSSGESPEAANQLLRMGIRLLEKASRTDREAYTITVLNLTEDIPIGSCVRVNYSKGAKTVDKAFIVTSINASFNASGPSTLFVISLSDDGYLIDEKTGQVSLEIADTKDKTRYRQPTWTGDIEGSSGGGGGAAAAAGDNLGDHVAIQNLDMGTFAITNVGDVDGVDVSDLKSSYDSHVANTNNPHSIPLATTSADGLMSDGDKSKLNGIEAGAEVNDPTNLSYTASTRELASSTGNNTTLPEVVSGGNSGLMTGAAQSKLDGIEAGAEANLDTTSSHISNPGRVSESDLNGDMGFRRAFLGSAPSADAPLTIWAEAASGTRELFRGKTSAGASKIITRIASHGGLNQYMYNNAGTLQIYIDCDTTLNIELVGLPTTNPGGSGKLWNDGGTLKIT